MRFIHFLTIAATISACSPYAYKTEIDTFAKGVDGVVGFVGDTKTDLRNEPKNELLWRALADTNEKVTLDFLACDFSEIPRPAGPACRFKIAGEAIDRSEISVATEAGLEDFRKLTAYVDALRAVTAAEDSEAYAAATAKLSSTAAAFSGAILPSVGPAVGAAVQIFGVISRVQLEQGRLNALRQAVFAVDPLMETATADIGRALNELASARATYIFNQANHMHRAHNAAPKDAFERRRALLELMTARVATANALGAFNGEALIMKMRLAHGALAKALKESEPDLSIALKAIGEFVDAVAEFKSAL